MLLLCICNLFTETTFFYLSPRYFSFNSWFLFFLLMFWFHFPDGVTSPPYYTPPFPSSSFFKLESTCCLTQLYLTRLLAAAGITLTSVQGSSTSSGFTWNWSSLFLFHSMTECRWRDAVSGSIDQRWPFVIGRLPCSPCSWRHHMTPCSPVVELSRWVFWCIINRRVSMWRRRPMRAQHRKLLALQVTCSTRPRRELVTQRVVELTVQPPTVAACCTSWCMMGNRGEQSWRISGKKFDWRPASAFCRYFNYLWRMWSLRVKSMFRMC